MTVSREERIWKAVNGRRLAAGMPLVPLARVQRACKLMLGPACAFVWPRKERQPYPKKPRLYGPHRKPGKPSMSEPRQPREKKLCIGHDTPQGHVECGREVRSAGGALRCYDCGCRQMSHESNTRRKRMRDEARAERLAARESVAAPARQVVCEGYANVKCGVLFSTAAPNTHRCDKCRAGHKKWYDKARFRSYIKGPKAAALLVPPNRTGEEHRVTHWCEECAGLSERRPTVGLCKCGLPWAPEKIERREVLRSSAGGEFVRNHGR